MIKIEPLLTPTPHCVFSSRIRGSSVKNKFDSLSNLQLNLHDRASKGVFNSSLLGDLLYVRFRKLCSDCWSIEGR